jgi:ribosome maturation factor RimP
MARLDPELMARLERLATSEGVELLAVEVAGTARKPMVRLVLDREVGGVSLADCENVSRQASVLLDAYDPFPGSFTLEVTSPGLDRKLYKDKDYVRFAGQLVRVRMRPGYPPPRVFDGTLEGKADGMVRVRDDKGTLHELLANEVLDVRLTPFKAASPAPSKGSGRKHQR